MRFLILFIPLLFLSSRCLPSTIDWRERESAHFRVIYHEGHGNIVPHILRSAEAALERLCRIFNYSPGEKIVINTFDLNDYGSAFTTTVPHNYIWLDLAPMEPGYENIPYNERLRWLLSHELVHVVANDLANRSESLSRSLFSKVQPEQIHPLSVPYSLLTNYSRYTPRWHQEGIAVFLETWLSGGYGRSMGSFDEMFFRSLVDEGRTFPSVLELETIEAHSSFLSETNYYLYGGRFVTFLVAAYGTEKVFQWYKEGAAFQGYRSKFSDVFGMDFSGAWNAFIEHERAFQGRNLLKLKTAPPTFSTRLSDNPSGSVTQPHFRAKDGTVLWGEHRPDHLASFVKFNVKKRIFREIETLRAPSMFQVASTAYDEARDMLFYTTKNNQLYRDLWMLNVRSGESMLLFEDGRVGHLTVSPATHELWGIRHGAGMAQLVCSKFPYRNLEESVLFDFGDEVQGLAVSPAGDRLAAVVHKASGEQSLVLVEIDKLKSGNNAPSILVSGEGSPENPSWSRDGTTLYWNAYTNGVSNIYRKRMTDSSSIVAVTHTLRGFFKPLELDGDALFAFEFSSAGFVPVIIPNRKAVQLPAIEYLGQNVRQKFPSLAELKVGAASDTTFSQPGEYNPLKHVEVASIFPVLSGFQRQKILGLFGHFSDPILDHDCSVEMGVSPFGESQRKMRFHLRLKYEYRKEYEVNWEHNGPDFFDLFNSRKRGMLGDKVRLANTHYWVYSNPLKMKQLSEIVLYTNVTSINDNIVQVSQPDFILAQSVWNSQNLRRTIGSVDHESGDEFTVALMLFGSNPESPQTSFNLYGEWDHFSSLVLPHNIVHLKLAAGVHRVNDRLMQSRFYFGGFGNRELENVSVKQYRKVFSFPGIPVFSLGSDRFAKVMLENNLPPVRFADLSVGSHSIAHLDCSFFAQALLTKSAWRWWGVDIGFQIDLLFKHWFNLESTVSAGVARAWMPRSRSDEWFVSWKILKN